MKYLSLFFLPFFFAVNIASASVDCVNLKQKINAENKRLYQGLVQEALTEKVSSKKIDVSEVLADKERLAIFASTKTSEPGIFFFKNKEFIDVWGGWQNKKKNPTY